MRDNGKPQTQIRGTRTYFGPAIFDYTVTQDKQGKYRVTVIQHSPLNSASSETANEGFPTKGEPRSSAPTP